MVLGALLTSVFMHPDDHIGDRSACLFIAFLILVTNMQTDLGLGRLSTLIWLDCFNLIQLALVLVAVTETMVVHQMLKKQRDMLATNIDLSSRTVLPFVLYPGVTVATLIGFVDIPLGVALLAVAIVVSICWLLILTRKAQKRQQQQQLKTVAAFIDCKPNDEQFETISSAVFKAFDLDNSGERLGAWRA